MRMREFREICKILPTTPEEEEFIALVAGFLIRCDSSSFASWRTPPCLETRDEREPSGSGVPAFRVFLHFWDSVGRLSLPKNAASSRSGGLREVASYCAA